MAEQEMHEVLLLTASVLAAFAVSGLCSLLEAALLSLTPSQQACIRQDDAELGDLCRKLKREVERPIAVILIINTAAHTVGAAVAGAQFDKLCGERWLLVFSLVFTLGMVQYTEILPKTLGVRFNVQVMKVAARPLAALVMLMKPLIELVYFINRPFEHRRKQPGPSTAEEISALAALARSSQQISSRQERIINAAPLLSKENASEVMIPLERIASMSDTQTLTDAINLTGRDFHTWYPVFDDGNPDRVLGYVNFKEIVACSRSGGNARLTDILRPIDFADADESASALLERFVTQHCHMAIVRDKNGRTIGLVTLEDIVEELLGDLDDEFDPLPRTFYSPSEGVWVVGGGIAMTILGRDTRLALPKRSEPVSVWFTGLLDRQVRVGDVYRTEQAEFMVRKVRRGRVLEFTLKRLTQD